MKGLNDAKNELVKTYIINFLIFWMLFFVTAIIIKQIVDVEDIENFIIGLKSNSNGEGGIVEQKKWFDIWMHNSITNLICIIIGIIPFIYLSNVWMVGNAILWGSVSGFLAIVAECSIFKSFIIGFGPHAIMESMANILGYTLGLLVCRTITKWIRKKNKKEDVIKRIVFYFSLYLFVIVPFLFGAGIIEEKITPLIMDKFV